MQLMKILVTALLALALSACASSPGTQDDISVENGNQHIAVAATLATFFCDENRWPNNVEELREYSELEQLPLPVEIDWSAITDPRTRITFSDTVKLRIPSVVIPAPGNAVSSVNSPPECSENNVETNVHIHLGD